MTQINHTLGVYYFRPVISGLSSFAYLLPPKYKTKPLFCCCLSPKKLPFNNRFRMIAVVQSFRCICLSVYTCSLNPFPIYFIQRKGFKEQVYIYLSFKPLFRLKHAGRGVYFSLLSSLLSEHNSL